MKLLFWIVLLAVIAFVLGFMRARPRRPAPPPPAPPPPPRSPVAMIACTECGAHLPVTEALPGRGGQFCSAEHRQQHEARLP